MKKVIIVHGWEGKPTSNWFPWLKSELETRGVQTEVPAMPNSELPRESEWLVHLRATIGEPEEDTFLIGHSLGCVTILRYLESLPEGVRVGGAVFVAGFSERIGFPELNNFFSCPVDFRRARRASLQQIVAIQSDNDKYVPAWHGEVFRDKLGARLVTIPNGGHFNRSEGFTEFPQALLELLDLMDVE
ncbi:MAG: alpha/beta fold hydrolase [Patescibacteria group bacterium]